MRSIVSVIDKILAKLPDNSKDQAVMDMKWDLIKIQTNCMCMAPEVLIEDTYWRELSSAILCYKDNFYDKMWYCEAVAILSDRTYDEIVKALSADIESCFN